MMVEALAVGDPHAAIRRKSGEEGVDQSALAYARLAAHQHELALASERELEPAIELGEGFLASDQALAWRRPHRWRRDGYRCDQPIAAAMPGLDIGGLRASSPSAWRNSWMQEVSASSPTARLPHTLSAEHLLGDDVLGMLDQDRQDGRGSGRRYGKTAPATLAVI